MQWVNSWRVWIESCGQLLMQAIMTGFNCTQIHSQERGQFKTCFGLFPPCVYVCVCVCACVYVCTYKLTIAGRYQTMCYLNRPVFLLNLQHVAGCLHIWSSVLCLYRYFISTKSFCNCILIFYYASPKFNLTFGQNGHVADLLQQFPPTFLLTTFLPFFVPVSPCPAWLLWWLRDITMTCK